ncbi:MAG: hypothetical protein GFH25_541324n42 [Chloroflexi bacterium AL-N10]|nr:hypothetical protein [Chloroflexi bacterium AL-N10]
MRGHQPLNQWCQVRSPQRRPELLPCGVRQGIVGGALSRGRVGAIGTPVVVIRSHVAGPGGTPGPALIITTAPGWSHGWQVQQRTDPGTFLREDAAMAFLSLLRGRQDRIAIVMDTCVEGHIEPAALPSLGILTPVHQVRMRPVDEAGPQTDLGAAAPARVGLVVAQTGRGSRGQNDEVGRNELLPKEDGIPLVELVVQDLEHLAIGRMGTGGAVLDKRLAVGVIWVGIGHTPPRWWVCGYWRT